MTDWKDSAKREFDGWSKSYDRSWLQRLFFRPSHDAILQSISVAPGARLLDVGCGTGQFARRILDERPDIEVVGMDLSDKMLDKARDNCWPHRSRFEAALGDSEALPFDDDQFDAVTCSHSFHHYPNQQAVVAEMRRVLKPTGQVCIVDGNRDGWWGWLVFDGVVTAIERGVHHCSARQFSDLLTTAGFAGVSQSAHGNIAPFLVTCALADKAATVKQRRAA